jgi:hypothetical protein
MNATRTLLLIAALAVLAAACSGGDDQPVATTIDAPVLTTVPPIDPTLTIVPDPPTPTSDPDPPPVTVTVPPTAPPKPEPARFVPTLPLEDGVLTLDLVFVDGSTALVQWPAEIDLVGNGLIPYGWGFISGGSSRDFFIRPGDIEDVFTLLGGAELLGEYPDGNGGMVGLWRPPEDDVDYLGFTFDGWTVLVYDYRNDLAMSDEDRALWATNFHGEISEDGFLVLSADWPLRLVFAGEYPSPLNMTLRGADGEVTLTPGACEVGVLDGIADDPFARWCVDEGNMIVEAYGDRGFQEAVFDGLVVRSVVIAEPPPIPDPDEEET